MIQKIATAAVYVEDQAKAVEFWNKQVGFEVRQEKSMGPNASWIEVAPRGAESCPVIYPKSMMQDWAERKPSIVFECEDVHQTYSEMRGRGVEFTQEPKDMAWSLFAIFVDYNNGRMLETARPECQPRACRLSPRGAAIRRRTGCPERPAISTCGSHALKKMRIVSSERSHGLALPNPVGQPTTFGSPTSIGGVTFHDAWNRRLMLEMDGLHVPFIGREDLIASKESAGHKIEQTWQG